MKNYEPNGADKVMQTDALNGGGNQRSGDNGGDFSGPLIRQATQHDAKRGHAMRGEARWRDDTKGEGDEATA